jgi:general secretion pathway protein E
VWALRLLIIGLLLHGLGSVLAAQDGSAQAPAQPGMTGQAAPAQPGAAGTAGKFPSAPTGFYRGNSPQQPVLGFYLNMLCVIAVLGVFAAWGYSAWWVDEDSRLLKVRPEFWNTMMLLGGIVGFVLALITPSFVGFIPLLALYATPLGFYIQERNARVPEASKVMTPQHLRNVAIRTLAKVGIHIGSQELIESAIGPSITFIGKSSTGRGDDMDRSKQVENSRGYLAAKELVYDAIQRRGTDIHLEPKEDELSIRIRIDGVMYPTEPFDRATGDALVNIFKVLSAMDITERRRPQDGSFRAELEGRQIDFRVNTQGTRFGEKMSMRILDQSNSVSTLAGLGFRKQLLEKLQEVIHQPHGLMLVCGPTGAGKSTTLYAALNEIDSTQRNIITVEDPVEYKMDNVNQIEINNKAGQTFATSLRSILRQDPDVVMIGEIRDGETAMIACQAANTGHMVFSTVHANDTLTALYRVIELGVEPYMLANSLSSILAQRLCRKLCSECKEAYKPKPEFLKQAGLPADKIEVFYRPPKDSTGCTRCGGLGFQGRIGVFEALVINDRMRDMIREKAPLSAFKAEARKNGMLSMKEEGLRLVVKGVTSIDELLRVVK